MPHCACPSQSKVCLGDPCGVIFVPGVLWGPRRFCTAPAQYCPPQGSRMAQLSGRIPTRSGGARRRPSWGVGTAGVHGHGKDRRRRAAGRCARRADQRRRFTTTTQGLVKNSRNGQMRVPWSPSGCTLVPALLFPPKSERWKPLRWSPLIRAEASPFPLITSLRASPALATPRRRRYSKHADDFGIPDHHLFTSTKETL